MNNVLPSPNSRERITSLDALRAFTLLGILLAHAIYGFGFYYATPQTTLDFLVLRVNDFLIQSKCNTIFNVLFGISFYLMLRNPKNSSPKFVWRCFLLMLIGLFNMLFYTGDVLLWYGFCGMFLVLFRNMNPKWLIIIAISMLVVGFLVLSEFKIGTLLFGHGVIDSRYGTDKSFLDVFTYPYAVVDFSRAEFNGDAGGLKILAMFILGYWIAKIGFIEHIQERLTKRLLLTIWVIFVIFLITNYLLQSNHFRLLSRITHFSGSAAYASALLYAYYHSGWCKSFLRFFEPYGKLGLTNYSIAGILGVVFINEFGLGLYKYPLPCIVLFFIVFFLLQAVFSYYWLRYFTYGPMEYIWRVATERKPIPFRRKSLA